MINGVTLRGQNGALGRLGEGLGGNLATQRDGNSGEGSLPRSLGTRRVGGVCRSQEKIRALGRDEGAEGWASALWA